MAKTRAASRSRVRAGERDPGWAGAWYVRVAVLVLVAVIALLVVILLGGGARADKLREYDAALFEAQRHFLKHFDPGSETNLIDAHRRFADGDLPPDRLDELAATWERDFAEARDGVRELDPSTPIGIPPTPDELIQASWFIAEGLEAWRGVAGMYPGAAALRRAADRASGALRVDLLERLDELLEQITGWQLRASNLHELGARQVLNLRQQWGVEAAPQVRPAAPRAGVGGRGGSPGAPGRR